MTTRRRWTDETIEAELAPIVAELHRMPKREELAERGLAGLWTALQRNGGVSAWRERMTSSDGAVSDEDVARRAYEISLEHGAEDHVGNWLEAERELRG